MLSICLSLSWKFLGVLKLNSFEFSFPCVKMCLLKCLFLSELIIKIIKQTGDGRIINRNYSYTSIGKGPRRADRENALFGARLRAWERDQAEAAGKTVCLYVYEPTQSGAIITCRNAYEADVNARTQGNLVSWSSLFDERSLQPLLTEENFVSPSAAPPVYFPSGTLSGQIIE